MSDEQKPARLPGPATVAIHGAVEAKRSGQPIVPPIVRSATFQWATPEDGELRYGRRVRSPRPGRSVTHWHHLDCAEERFGDIPDERR